VPERSTTPGALKVEADHYCAMPLRVPAFRAMGLTCGICVSLRWQGGE